MSSAETFMGIQPSTTRAESPSVAPVRVTLSALVLLAGSVRANNFGASLGRSILDLPLLASSTVLQQWGQQASNLAQTLGVERLVIRILLDHLASVPNAACFATNVTVQAERDRFDFRGSGGVLHDIAEDYPDHAYILVANAAAVLLDPLSKIFESLVTCNADIAIHAQPDGTPSGLMLIRCGTLRQIAPVGFVDMKEQALPAIARSHSVRVVYSAVECQAIRSLPEYLAVLHQQARRNVAGATSSPQGGGGSDPYEEDWQSSFAVVENGSQVAPDVRIHDAVVLAGARVETHAVVVRSVVGKGGIIRRGQMVVHQIVGPGSERR